MRGSHGIYTASEGEELRHTGSLSPAPQLMWLDKYDLTSSIEETAMAFICCNASAFENQNDSSNIKLFGVGVIQGDSEL
jgi:hypothetical protein